MTETTESCLIPRHKGTGLMALTLRSQVENDLRGIGLPAGLAARYGIDCLTAKTSIHTVAGSLFSFVTGTGTFFA
jgi:hypothetical protein